LLTQQTIDIHLDHLKPFNGTLEEAKEAAALDVTSEYLVESIVSHKFVRRPHNIDTIRFKIHWQGWGPTFDVWRKYSAVEELVALDEYLANNPALLSVVPASPLGSGNPSGPPATLGGGSVAEDDSSHALISVGGLRRGRSRGAQGP
jgi:hypothetical protein